MSKTARPIIPDPIQDPSGFLLAKGWTLYDGDPRTALSRWLDPMKPRTASDKRVKTGTRKLADGTSTDIIQTQHTPAAWPIWRGEAVALQLNRDKQGATT